MGIKLLMLMSSLLSATGQQESADDENKSVMLIKKTIRLEIIYASLVLSVGLILSSVIIYAMIQLGELLQVYLNRYDNGDSIQVIIFSLIIISGFILFFVSLKKDAYKAEFNTKRNQNSLIPFNIENLGRQFLEGFVQGLNSIDEQNNIT